MIFIFFRCAKAKNSQIDFLFLISFISKEGCSALPDYREAEVLARLFFGPLKNSCSIVMPSRRANEDLVWAFCLACWSGSIVAGAYPNWPSFAILGTGACSSASASPNVKVYPLEKALEGYLSAFVDLEVSGLISYIFVLVFIPINIL